MEELYKKITNFDCYHCVERQGFIFTSIMEPVNIFDAIVVRNPENSESVSPIKAYSKKTLEENIKLINDHKLEKACVIADNIEFLLQCPTLKYLEIIPSKSALHDFDYSPLYKMPEIKYLSATTEYGDNCKPIITSIDYSKIKGLIDVRISGKGHCNINKLNVVEHMSLDNLNIENLVEMEFYNSLKSLDVLKTGIKSLKGIERFNQIQWLSLNYEKNIKDLSEIVFVSDTLRALSIENCSKITDFSFLEQLINLEYLELWGTNKLSDLNFLNRLSKLKTFSFSMEIENGDLSPCMNIPYVWCKKNRKGYNLKDKDLPKKTNVGGFKFI